MSRWLAPQAASIADKLRAGQVLRLMVIDRPNERCQLRLGFSPADTVPPQAVEPLLRRGLAVLGADGAIRHGGS